MVWHQLLLNNALSIAYYKRHTFLNDLFPGVIIETKGTWYYLVYGEMRVRWNDENAWLLTIEESVNEPGSNTFRGLCGNMDGDPFSKFSYYVST